MFDGTQWGPPVTLDRDNSFASVSCPTASFCVAVEFGGKAMTFDGHVWGPPVPIGGYPYSVSCTGPDFCAAVGEQGQGWTFDGISWTGPETIDYGPRGDGPKSISCVSPTFCMVVDKAGNVLTYDGNGWGYSSLIDPPKEDRSPGFLNSVSCSSRSSCVAVDLFGYALVYSSSGEPPPPPPPPAPSNSSPPSITGLPLQGQTLTAVRGTWTENPTSYARQWIRCDPLGAACTAIPGATSETYTLKSSDAGHTIRLQEWASNANGTGGPAQSDQTLVVLGVPVSRARR
jgi:hypothetical protein